MWLFRVPVIMSNMKTSGKNLQNVCIVTYLICVIQVNGASLNITKYPQYPTASSTAILTCHSPSFTAGAQWFRNGTRLTQCFQSSVCFPPGRPGYEFSVDATTMNITISSLDNTLDETTWTCAHNTGVAIGSINLTVYKLPSNLSIVGDNSRTLSDGDNVLLSVSTGCIKPSDSAYYNVTWKYVEASKTAENNFDEKIIMQNVSSIGGCTNTYEGNLKFILIVTNQMNTVNTNLYISQVKMTLTMAGEDFIATKNVSYTLNPKVVTTFARTSTYATTSTFARTFVTTFATTYNLMSRPGASSTLTSSQSTIANASSTSTSSQSTIPNASSTSTSINPTATIKSPTGNNVLKNTASDADIKVIVPALVVPCGLVIIGAIIFLVVWYLRRRTRKHVHESPDGNKKDEWKQTGHTNTIDNHNAVYTSPDGFIIYLGPAARSTVRSYKDKKSHGGTDQYSRPDSWTYHHQADYTPNTLTSAYTHKGKHPVTNQYCAPYTAAYGYQTAYLPSTHKSARTYEYMADNYDIEGHQQASHPIATSRLAFRHDKIGEIHTTQDTAFY